MRRRRATGSCGLEFLGEQVDESRHVFELLRLRRLELDAEALLDGNDDEDNDLSNPDPSTSSALVSGRSDIAWVSRVRRKISLRPA